MHFNFMLYKLKIKIINKRDKVLNFGSFYQGGSLEQAADFRFFRVKINIMFS